MGRRTLTPDEVAALAEARERATYHRSYAAGELATLAVNHPDRAIGEDWMRRAARLIATTSADWNPPATAIEVDSWDMPTDWEMAG